jgi:hypothetical protein
MEADLTGGKTASFAASLTPAFGQLALKSLVPGAQVTVDYRPVKVVAGTTLELPVGTHQVRVFAPLYSTFDETVVISGGETSEIDLHLTPDQAQLNQLRARALQSSQIRTRRGRSSSTSTIYQGSNQSALDAASTYLQFSPNDSAVLASYAVSLYSMNRMDLFLPAAKRALAAGATLSFPVRHPHGNPEKGANSPRITAANHPAVLTIQSDLIGYSPGAFKCPVKAFSRPPSAFQLDDAEHDVLGLRFADPAKPKKLVKLDLTDPMGRIPELSQLVRLVIEGKVY